MKLLLNRDTLLPELTLGTIVIADTGWPPALECYTLEDTVRPAGVKIPGKTAIPYGTYEIVISQSPHFNGEWMPRLLEVPMFEGILIHPGNSTGDTEGCILVGRLTDGYRLARSREAYSALFMKLAHAQLSGERSYITVGTRT